MDSPGWLPLVSGGRVAVGGDKLRHWGISETWRIRWTGGSTTIVKRGAGAEALALDVYEQVLIPGRIAAPRLIAAHRGDGFVVLEFEDVGAQSLAQRPSTDGWLAAARLLARLRNEARGRMDAGSRFRFSTAELTDTWRRAATALAGVRPDLAGALDGCEPLLEPRPTPTTPPRRRRCRCAPVNASRRSNTRSRSPRRHRPAGSTSTAA
ncbi:hypothetical protein [Actinoplanes sp. NBRC 103695]|uniref:hypothetical protein n=1 Tax=Actinoplanes sp. NBRC 103695 TaxID=3032202 RepID=UPI0024A491AE|nr:hypothetical protein [Actinoplanes sp. NBRC 103695]GLY99566.1 hypothetical protein Acsp02_68190 [Actinoplanes sp. NBRC 103695]